MYNDLPLSDRPPNIIQLERAQNGDGLPSFEHDDTTLWTASDDLNFFTSPFPKTFTKRITVDSSPITTSPNCFGFVFQTDALNNRVFISEVLNKSDAARLCKSKNAKRSIIGAYVVAINDHPIYTQEEAIHKFHTLHHDNAVSFDITFGITNSFSKKDLRKAMVELELDTPSFKTPSPSLDLDDTHVPSLTLNDICHITALTNDDYDYNDLITVDPSELLIAINAIKSSSTTPEDQGLGTFTRRKLKQLPNWHQWRDAEFQQLDRFAALEMYGAPQVLPIQDEDDPYVLLRSHWQHAVKRCGTR